MIHAPHPLLDLGLRLERERPRKIAAACDLAFVTDGCALVILEHHADRVDVIDSDFRVPSPVSRFDPVSLCDEYLDRVALHGCAQVTADVHYLEVLRRSANARGITLHPAPGFDHRAKAWALLRQHTRAKTIRFPKLVGEHLRKIKSTPKPGGGLTIFAPRETGLGHADLAFALVAAAWLDFRLHGPIGETPTSVATHRGRWDSP